MNKFEQLIDELKKFVDDDSFEVDWNGQSFHPGESLLMTAFAAQSELRETGCLASPNNKENELVVADKLKGLASVGVFNEEVASLLNEASRIIESTS
ncbi:hypothetical protein [Vibrio agarivorans]|uniref:Uncharacterized protein n=1 Tax=Vibrio agarivorans TaxID=153622 RepID=A0ABT7Y781_9VIBR|nr:hypothetical protein [Vibrio agarivorans]MDN2483841.1 hypothetical protein [Vibrio agarivorans]